MYISRNRNLNLTKLSVSQQSVSNENLCVLTYCSSKISCFTVGICSSGNNYSSLIIKFRANIIIPSCANWKKVHERGSGSAFEFSYLHKQKDTYMKKPFINGGELNMWKNETESGCWRSVKRQVMCWRVWFNMRVVRGATRGTPPQCAPAQRPYFHLRLVSLSLGSEIGFENVVRVGGCCLSVTEEVSPRNLQDNSLFTLSRRRQP